MPATGDAPRYRVWPPVALGVPLAAGLLASARWPLGIGLPDAWRRPIAASCLLAFLAVNGSAYLAMWRARTGVLPGQPATRLLTAGPFRWSRNPLYLGLTLLYVSIALWWNSGWALILLPLALWALVLGAIVPEERYLTEKFGDEYLAYRARVRRWL